MAMEVTKVSPILLQHETSRRGLHNAHQRSVSARSPVQFKRSNVVRPRFGANMVHFNVFMFNRACDWCWVWVRVRECVRMW